jgi:DNA-binding transcriptional ArsR family regulator
MARAKTEAFDPALIRTAGLAKALGHPVRIRILEILRGRRACVCGGLVDRLPLAQSTVSQHLRELREAGLIRGDVDGPRTCYCLDPKAVAEARAAFQAMFRRICEPIEEVPEGLRSGACALPSRRARQPGGRPSVRDQAPDKARKT